ncbi:MAG: RNA polymerase sigma factor [Gammaproteobacteria bacterium]
MLARNLELEKFLVEVEKRAFRIAEISTGNRDDALDILQDALYKFVDKYATRNPEEWGPLFHTILQRMIVDWYRRNAVRERFRGWFGRQHSHHDDENEDPIQNVRDEYGKTPEQEVHSGRRVAMLDSAIRDLPLRQQQAFLLRMLEGYDVKQTAKIMNCSDGSVKTHYSRAVHDLRGKLGDDWL